MVGDIGEVLAAEKYGLRLLEENAVTHDAEEIATGRMVQIKSSFKGNSYFPFGVDRIPEYFLSVVISDTGEIKELFNGPGQYIYDNYIIKKNLKGYRDSYYPLSKGVLIKFNTEVDEKDKIKIVSLNQ